MMGGRTKSKQTGHSNRDVRSFPDAVMPLLDDGCCWPIREHIATGSDALGLTAMAFVGAIRFVSRLIWTHEGDEESMTRIKGMETTMNVV
jgi:hypothetical protein